MKIADAHRPNPSIPTAVDPIVPNAAVMRETPEALAEAVTLYTIPLLDGCAEEWAPQERRARQ